MKWKKRGDKKFAYKARREDRHNSIAKRLVTSRNHNISFKCFGSWRLFYHILRAIRPEQLIWRYFLDNKRLTSRRDKAVSGQCSSHASDFKSRKNGRAEMNLEGESCVEPSKYRYRTGFLVWMDSAWNWCDSMNIKLYCFSTRVSGLSANH